MNEQIKRAWDQAAKPITDDSWESQIAFIERFANIMVKETLDAARAGIEFGDGMEPAVEAYWGIKLSR